MTSPLHILLLMATSASLSSIAPLTETQSIQLQTTTDHTTIIDEAPFYALLHNATDWPATEAGATIPDFSQITSNPQNARGQLFLIEGQLEMQMPQITLSRSGFENTRGLVLRIPQNSSDNAKPSTPIIIYLTNPPPLTESLYGNDVLNQRGAPVRLVARFYKILTRNNRDGQPASYPLFVGHAVSQIGKPSASSSQPRFDIMFLFAILALGAWGFWRVHRLRKYVNSPNKGPLAHHRHRKQAQIDTPEESLDDSDLHSTLPQDPADALNQLYQNHQQEPPTSE